MSLHLYNSLAKKLEDFDAFMADRKTVTMYTCGPTVYSRPHIGNYSSFLMADLLRRWLEVKGYEVKHVKNITDVGHLLHDAEQGDDKIESEAKKQKVSPLEIAKKYTDAYLKDENTLNILEPFARPKATEYVEQMKEMIEVLLKKGSAYITEDGIYFDVTQMLPTPYGSLSGNTLENIESGKRVEVNELKRHPADFALWKFCVGVNAHHVLRWKSPTFAKATAGKPGGDNLPEGFPGWHIECSAMSSSLLGDQIDIHTGGEDNIFPHHECEIAQSESATGKKPFVRFWLHKRRVNLENEKMSKSLGNVLTLDDIVAEGYSLMDLRYYFLSIHYRTPMKFSWKGMEDAHSARKKIMEWMKEVEEMVSGTKTMSDLEAKSLRQSVIGGFTDIMDQDLNTSSALGFIFTIMNNSRAEVNKEKGWSSQELDIMREFVEMFRKTFGCFDKEEVKIPAEVSQLFDARKKAREEKNFAESDRLRDEIAKRGFEVRDTSEGQVMKKL